MLYMYTVFVYIISVIISFGDAATEDLYNGRNSKAARRIDKKVWPVAARKLDILHAATGLKDLKSPGNHLEKLTADLVGFWSIRVNDQYRIIFRFSAGNASEVRCQDIH